MRSKLFVGAFVSWFLSIGAVPCSVTAQGTPESKPEASNAVSRPSCLKCPSPEFPDKARKSKIKSGKVLLEVTISAEGRVANPQVLEDPGYGFAERAVSAAENWKFKPAATKDGKIVPARIKIEITFHE